ncbi:hypothetical protein [Anaeroselena agilis]|uniref:Uncharacterized protein n=1 Tax=Anaeroselena agilis TaxID=3063788 RepID=A0ABU3NTM0_9FIRM|nr:hypothetical protein [Selenomonadales bacterium 4137-cl]
MTPLKETTNFVFWMDRACDYLQVGDATVTLECAQESRLDFYNNKDSKLPAYLLYAVFRATFGGEWVDSFERLHQGRAGMWKVESFFQPNGMKEYRLYTITEHEPVCSSAITVVKNKVNTFSIYAEDAAPLLRRVIEDHPPVFFPRYRNNRSTYCLKNQSCDKYFFTLTPTTIKSQREATRTIKVDKDKFLYDAFRAGEASGLKETIDALKCLEVLLA